MRILLDTHTFLWFAGDAPQLSQRAKAAIQTPGNTVNLSMVSIWEIALKVRLEKLSIAAPLDELVDVHVENHGFQLLQIETPHIYQTMNLPFHHRDPFDRLLIAQANVENMPIVGTDSSFSSYEGLSLIW